MASEQLPENEITTEAARLMLAGHSLQDVIEFLQTKNPNLSFEDAASWVFDSFVSATDVPTEARRGWCIEAFRELYRKMIEIGDFAGAVRCVSEIAKLAGLKQGPPKEEKPKPKTKTKPEENDWISQFENLS